MALIDDLAGLESARAKTGGTRCRIAIVLGQMSEDERAALEHLLDNTEVFGTQIADALKNNGYQVSGGHVQYHRRRTSSAGCSCPVPGETG